MRRAIIVLVGSVMMLGGWTCNIPRWEFNWRTFRFERVGPRRRPAGPVKPSTAADADAGKRKTERPAPQIPERTVPAATTDQAGELAAIEKERLYRLYLSTGKANEAVPAENTYVVRKAPVAKLAELLVLLYPGEGPGGRPDVRYVIYRNRDVWREARRFAELLDHAGSVGETAVNRLWREALDELYATEFPRKVAPEKRFRIITALNRLINDPGVDLSIRWAAGLITGHLFSRYDPKDHLTAGASLALAGRLVRDRPFQSMVVRYHQIRQLASRGEKLKAAKLARETLDYFRGLQKTLCYQMIQHQAQRK